MMRRLFPAGLMLMAGWSGSTGPKLAELSELPAGVQVRTLWQASVGNAGDAILFPALAVDGVYAAAQDGAVARFEASTGRGSWRGEAGGSPSRGGGVRRPPRGGGDMRRRGRGARRGCGG